MTFFPDGKSILVVGHEKDQPTRAYRQTLPDGLPFPLLPEGVFPGCRLTDFADGLLILGRDAKSGWQWHPVDGVRRGRFRVSRAYLKSL